MGSSKVVTRQHQRTLPPRGVSTCAAVCRSYNLATNASTSRRGTRRKMYRVVTKQVLPARQELCTPKRLPHQLGRLPSRLQ
ncbi:hypothetical protein IG631_14275 [Alternaria alternata]|nr:hypothetical protein IG631_14275 [Alternaria alternata]